MWRISYSQVPHPTLVHKLIESLHATFALKKLGRPEYFICIEVKHLPDGNLHLSQTKYICDILNRATMRTAKGLTTPILIATGHL